MKKITLIALMLFTALGYAQVGINTNNPDASSALEIESTTGGILIPRLTETQRDAISSPATGLMIYQTDGTAGFYYYNGSSWANVGYTEALVSANTDVAANTAKVGYTEALVSANTDVVANTAKVGYTDALVSANTDVAANTAKVGYTDALVSANTDVAANTAKVGYTEALVSANTDVAANTAKVGYTEALVSANTDVAANTAKVGYTEALVSANTDVAANTAKVGYTEALVSANTDVAANTAKVGYTDALVSANTDVAANTLKYSKNEVDTLIANLQTQITQITNNAISVGDFLQGGVVFYIFVDGDTGYVAGETHGLIAAVQDQSSGIRWYNGINVTTGATGTAIGTGSANTDAIINVQGPTETSYAAGLARAYTGGGHIDWFLPSKDELNKMYLNKNIINTTAAANSGSDFSANNYWSSTEYDSNTAWVQYFGNGGQGYYDKVNTYVSVRAVRAF